MARFGERWRDHQLEEEDEGLVQPRRRVSPGKRTLTMSIPSGISRRVTGGGVVSPNAWSQVNRAAGSSGQPLPDSLLPSLERAMGQDLGDTRIHTDSHAARRRQIWVSTLWADTTHGSGQSRR